MWKRSTTATGFLLLALALGFYNQAIAKEEQTQEERRLFVEGARLWPVYCSQCHNARPGSQFSPAQWDAITMHMKTLSNMPAKDMRAIKEFLKQAR
jgi:mono/diheme cytochrome c family protein